MHPLILKLWTKLWFVCQNRVSFEQLVLDAAIIIIIPRRRESFIHFLLFWHVNVEGKLNYLKTQVWMEPSLTQKQPDNLSSNRGRGLHIKTKSEKLFLMPLNTHKHTPTFKWLCGGRLGADRPHTHPVICSLNWKHLLLLLSRAQLMCQVQQLRTPCSSHWGSC